MNIKLKIFLKESLFIIFLWTFLLYFYLLITFWGTASFMKPGPILNYLHSNLIHVEVLVQGISFGIIFSMINFLTGRSTLKRRSFGFVILFRSFLYLMGLLFVGFLTYAIFLILNLLPQKELALMTNEISPVYILSTFTYVVFSILLINFILEVNRKFGPGNLFKLISGRYHKPRIEERIFMFLDMQNSTGIAEKLGHQDYSRFLRNCFHDLTDIVIKHKAEIYQYVGDEVVLTWNIDDGLNDHNCIRTYFEFEEKLKKHESFYKKNFGVLPHFKSGIDTGFVTLAEIGDIKRDIAYHGDTLNTAARIQEQCNKFGTGMLISGNLEKRMSLDTLYKKQLLGEINLRGKQKVVEVFSINPAAEKLQQSADHFEFKS